MPQSHEEKDQNNGRIVYISRALNNEERNAFYEILHYISLSGSGAYSLHHLGYCALLHRKHLTTIVQNAPNEKENKSCYYVAALNYPDSVPYLKTYYTDTMVALADADTLIRTWMIDSLTEISQRKPPVSPYIKMHLDLYRDTEFKTVTDDTDDAEMTSEDKQPVEEKEIASIDLPHRKHKRDAEQNSHTSNKKTKSSEPLQKHALRKYIWCKLCAHYLTLSMENIGFFAPNPRFIQIARHFADQVKDTHTLNKTPENEFFALLSTVDPSAKDNFFVLLESFIAVDPDFSQYIAPSTLATLSINTNAILMYNNIEEWVNLSEDYSYKTMLKNIVDSLIATSPRDVNIPLMAKRLIVLLKKSTTHSPYDTLPSYLFLEKLNKLNLNTETYQILARASLYLTNTYSTPTLAPFIAGSDRAIAMESLCLLHQPPSSYVRNELNYFYQMQALLVNSSSDSQSEPSKLIMYDLHFEPSRIRKIISTLIAMIYMKESNLLHDVMISIKNSEQSTLHFHTTHLAHFYSFIFNLLKNAIEHLKEKQSAPEILFLLIQFLDSSHFKTTDNNNAYEAYFTIVKWCSQQKLMTSEQTINALGHSSHTLWTKAQLGNNYNTLSSNNTDEMEFHNRLLLLPFQYPRDTKILLSHLQNHKYQLKNLSVDEEKDYFSSVKDMREFVLDLCRGNPALLINNPEHEFTPEVFIDKNNADEFATNGMNMLNAIKNDTLQPTKKARWVIRCAMLIVYALPFLTEDRLTTCCEALIDIMKTHIRYIMCHQSSAFNTDQYTLLFGNVRAVATPHIKPLLADCLDTVFNELMTLENYRSQDMSTSVHDLSHSNVLDQRQYEDIANFIENSLQKSDVDLESKQDDNPNNTKDHLILSLLALSHRFPAACKALLLQHPLLGPALSQHDHPATVYDSYCGLIKDSNASFEVKKVALMQFPLSSQEEPDNELDDDAIKVFDTMIVGSTSTTQKLEILTLFLVNSSNRLTNDRIMDILDSTQCELEKTLPTLLLNPDFIKKYQRKTETIEIDRFANFIPTIQNSDMTPQELTRFISEVIKMKFTSSMNYALYSNTITSLISDIYSSRKIMLTDKERDNLDVECTALLVKLWNLEDIHMFSSAVIRLMETMAEHKIQLTLESFASLYLALMNHIAGVHRSTSHYSLLTYFEAISQMALYCLQPADLRYFMFNTVDSLHSVHVDLFKFHLKCEFIKTDAASLILNEVFDESNKNINQIILDYAGIGNRARG